jgi:hypothetical protein
MCIANLNLKISRFCSAVFSNENSNGNFPGLVNLEFEPCHRGFQIPSNENAYDSHGNGFAVPLRENKQQQAQHNKSFDCYFEIMERLPT